MIERTEQEIKDFCWALWKDDRYEGSAELSNLEIDATGLGTKEIRVRVSQMYDTPTLNLMVMMKFAEFFGTRNINDDDRFNENGCETCDYGSSHGFTLTIRPEPK